MSWTLQQNLERARELIADSIDRMEEAQRVLFHAGDAYVARVQGSGVRSVLDLTERMAEVAGELSHLHIEVGKLARREGADPGP
jgi:hypothetical protein